MLIKPPRLIEIGPEVALYRIHRPHRDALCFGPLLGAPPLFRFDDPEGKYKVCYVGTTIEVAFAETFLREPPVVLVSRAALADRVLTTIQVRRTLRLAMLYGAGLAAIGVTATVSTGPYDIAQMWSRRIWEDDTDADGIMYASKHDNSLTCVALFDRARSRVHVVSQESLLDDTRRLGALLDRYQVALIP
jgi:hypothetical protein